jgi:hypothetical protein
MNMKKQFPLLIIGALVIAGVSFYGGMLYSTSSSSMRSANGAGFQQFRNGGGGEANTQGAFRRGGPGGMGGFTAGEILFKDDKSITVKLRDGGSKIVFYSGSTTIGKMADGTAADLEVGKDVMVAGSANADGSVNAQSIQIRPLPLMPTATSTPKDTNQTR